MSYRILASLAVLILFLLSNLGTLTQNKLSYIYAQAVDYAIQAVGMTTRISISSDGEQANGASETYRQFVSKDGYLTVFSSEANNLVSNDTNGVRDTFVHNLLTGKTTRISVASDGTEGNAPSQKEAIAADGRYVAFRSMASNLIANDTNMARDIFVHDMASGETTRISIASDGSEGNDQSDAPAISANGRYISFQSYASNLVPNDTNKVSDTFIHDRELKRTVRVSVSSDGMQGNGDCFGTAISADGRFVAFRSEAGNLVNDDTNNKSDLFVHDRDVDEDGIFDEPGQISTVRVSLASDGTQGNGSAYKPTISADGQYVSFQSTSSNLVADDTNGEADIFVHNQLTGETSRVSVASDGTEANGLSDDTSLSGNGYFVTFYSEANNLVDGDTNDLGDIFVHDLKTSQTIAISLATDNTFGNGKSGKSHISADGRFVAFYSEASNLVNNDTNNIIDIFIQDTFEDVTSPASISDLKATPGTSIGDISLRWTSPGDDGDIGTASEYILRYNMTPITDENFDTAMDVANEPMPKQAGNPETLIVSGLTTNETYYFAIKSSDEVFNISPLSNNASAVSQAVELDKNIYLPLMTKPKTSNARLISHEVH